VAQQALTLAARHDAVAVAVLTVALPALGPVARLLGFVPMPWTLTAALPDITAAYLVATEVARRAFVRGGGRRRATAAG
jgi:hypothetical protein